MKQFSIKELIMQSYLQITLKVADKNREAAAGVYTKYLEPFLNTTPAQYQNLFW